MERGFALSDAVAPIRPRVALAAFGRATFDLDQARTMLHRSRAALRALPVDLAAASELLTEPAAARDFARTAAEAGADLLVCQFTTFVDARFIADVAEGTDLPLLLWSLREPGAVGERLSLNSLTGANLAARQLHGQGRFFRVVLGDPEEEGIGRRVVALGRAAAVRRQLDGFRVLVLGGAPDGFFFSAPAPTSLRAAGASLVQLDLDRLFAQASALPRQAWASRAADARRSVAGLDRLPAEQVEKFARLQAVVEGELAARGASAVAVRCWPEFFTDFGAAACSFVSALCERGIAASCEADVLGALTMTVLARLAGGSPYLGDLAAVDAERGAVVFWHCGAGAFSLASPRTGPVAGVQPNRRIGFTLEFALKPGRVTIARIGETPAGLRLLVGGGEALDAPQRFLGTAATVRLDGGAPVDEQVRRLLEAGWEPHYALVYGDVRQELRDLAAMTGLPVEEM